MKSPTFHATSVPIEALIRIKVLWNFFAASANFHERQRACVDQGRDYAE